MIQVAGRTASLMVLYTISLHYKWMICLLIDPAAANATALAVFEKVMGISPLVLPAIFCFVATLALMALLVPAGILSVVLMLPQQCTLMISAWGALHAIWLGQFGDGVVRPRAFIAADQPMILAALFHTLAIIRIGASWENP